MPYSIPGFTKCLIYFGNNTIFVYFSWHPLCLWICYGARSLHFTVSPGRKGTLFFLHIQLRSHQKDLNCSLWLYYYGKVIVELENNANNRKRLTDCLMCLQSDQVTLWNYLFIYSTYLFLISNNVWAIFSLGDHQITFVTLNTFYLLSKPARVGNHLLFLADKTKLDGTPSKIKWKIHVFWYTVF